jgi:hypothetical protein
MSVLVKKNDGITGGSPLDKGVGDVNSMVMGPSSRMEPSASRPSELRAQEGNQVKAVRSRLASFASKGPAWGDLLDELEGVVENEGFVESLGEVAPSSGEASTKSKKSSGREVNAEVKPSHDDAVSRASVMPSQGLSSSSRGGEVDGPTSVPNEMVASDTRSKDDIMVVTDNHSPVLGVKAGGLAPRVSKGSFDDGNRTITVEEYNNLKQLLLEVSRLSYAQGSSAAQEQRSVTRSKRSTGSRTGTVPASVGPLRMVDPIIPVDSGDDEDLPSSPGSSSPSSSSSESSSSTVSGGADEMTWRSATSRKKQKRATRSLSDLKQKLLRYLYLERLEDLLSTLPSKSDKVKLCRLLLQDTTKINLLAEVPTLTGCDLLVLLGLGLGRLFKSELEGSHTPGMGGMRRGVVAGGC